MTIHKCDKCKVEIERSDAVTVARGLFGADINHCNNCAKPILVLLNKLNLSLPEPVK